MPRMDPSKGFDLGAGMRKRSRYPTAEEVEALKAEIERVKMKLGERQAERLEAETNSKRCENLVKKMQIQVKKCEVQHEEEILRIKSELRREKDKLAHLQDVVESRRRKQSIGDSEERERLRTENSSLDSRCHELTASEAKLRQQVASLETEVGDFRLGERKQVLELKMKISESSALLEREKLEGELKATDCVRANERQRQLDVALAELEATKLQRDELRRELEQNRDAVVEREAVSRKLNEFPILVKENDKLKVRNQLLVETAENALLLKAKIQDLEDNLEKAQAGCKDALELKENLARAEKRLNQWNGLCKQVTASSSEAEEVKEEELVGVQVLSRKIAEMQRSIISSRAEAKNTESRCEAASETVAQLRCDNEKLRKEVSCCKNHVEQQASIIKRFKRKLLLVSKERDSVKGVLESYEHELTFTGGQFEKDRLVSMEAVVKEHENTIEQLEAELAKALGVDAIHAREFLKDEGRKPNEIPSLVDEHDKLKAKIGDLEGRLEKAQDGCKELADEKAELKHELERRAIRGDFDPSATKVLHFKRNPATLARQEHEVNADKLRSDNEALKARVRLLEEGHSKQNDLTLLVDKKVNQGAEVQELRDQLKSKDLQRQRLIEAFQTTSQTFREVCCQLTGYRIDGLQNNQYRLSHVYAERPDEDWLLFRRQEGHGECLELLETQFSARLNDLMDLHLGQQNSIPVFLAALTMDLFSRQTSFENTVSVVVPPPAAAAEEQPSHSRHIVELQPDCDDDESVSASDEQDLDEEEYGGEEEEFSGGGEESSQYEEAGGDDDDPICID